MTGDHASRTEPLRAADPRRLGCYELVGRLGEGGMGTVFLARATGGRLVAVKVVRLDLAPDREFRRRFRGEVNQARQVPPFCTAEVLDADPDHEPPYLVVEYVDGPSLAAVVQEQGPLTPANLHGVAIGVATALTAIHGAGVIHRDLKPTNVLLAPGSPKVIDFGIARAVAATSDLTGHRMLGTVAYMAPERFGSTAGSALTCAADIFAWGAVVAYAGTGRTPFTADTPPLVAVRILTEPPDLTGLVSPLRELVERALAKEPDERPTARELLDLLLTAVPARVPALAAALADQPALRIAAKEAQAATDQGSAAAVTAMAAAALPIAPASPPPAPAPPVPDDSATMRLPLQRPSPSEDPTTVIRTSGGSGAERSSARTARRRAIRQLALLMVVVLLGAVSAAGAVVLLGQATDNGEFLSDRSPPDQLLWPQVVVQDDLTTRRLWPGQVDDKHKATCAPGTAAPANGLVVRSMKVGTYRCRGPQDNVGDFAMNVEVRLRTPDSCAGVWFHFSEWAGYVLAICADRYLLLTHQSATIKPLREYPFAGPVAVDTPMQVGITVQGDTIKLDHDGERLGQVQDATFTRGVVELGIFQQDTARKPPFEVVFKDVLIRE